MSVQTSLFGHFDQGCQTTTIYGVVDTHIQLSQMTSEEIADSGVDGVATGIGATVGAVEGVGGSIIGAMITSTAGVSVSNYLTRKLLDNRGGVWVA